MIVSDIANDPLWADFKDIALQYNLRSCWSTPILSSTNEVLGSFAIYYTEVKTPNEFHLDLISKFTHLSRLAIEKDLNEAVLRDSKNYNRSLFEHSPIGLALCRLNGELVDVNSVYANIIGRSIEDTLKLSYWDITPKKYENDEMQQIEDLESTGSYGPYEKEYIHKDGHLVPVRLTGMYHEENGELFILSSVEDITEKKQIEESLRRSQKMDAIGQLTGGIAHDFNNILAIILGNIDLLNFHISNNVKASQRIDLIKKATLRAADLTRQLLSFSRKHDREMLPCNINLILSGIEKLISRTVTAQVELNQNLSNELWHVEIDSGDFEDVILNLTLNARDAMPNGGRLSIETSNRILDSDYCAINPDVTPGEYVLFSISDTGTGISKEEQEHIFEPFFTTKPDGKGTGLGLAMVFGFVKRCSGHIRVISEVGKGTTIEIYLPRSIEQDLSTSETIRQVQEIATGNETILIVDDEEGLLELSKENLQGLGYRVLTATNGRKALEHLRNDHSIKLLFSDIVMPGGLNGYELAKKTIMLYPEIKILLTSGYSEKIMFNNDFQNESFIVLDKPYSQSDLAFKIQQLLNPSKNTKD